MLKASPPVGPKPSHRTTSNARASRLCVVRTQFAVRPGRGQGARKLILDGLCLHALSSFQRTDAAPPKVVLQGNLVTLLRAVPFVNPVASPGATSPLSPPAAPRRQDHLKGNLLALSRLGRLVKPAPGSRSSPARRPIPGRSRPYPVGRSAHARLRHVSRDRPLSIGARPGVVNLSRPLPTRNRNANNQIAATVPQPPRRRLGQPAARPLHTGRLRPVTISAEVGCAVTAAPRRSAFTAARGQAASRTSNVRQVDDESGARPGPGRARRGSSRRFTPAARRGGSAARPCGGRTAGR